MTLPVTAVSASTCDAEAEILRRGARPRALQIAQDIAVHARPAGRA